MNLYEYCFGDPINMADPDGREPGYWQQVGQFGLGELKGGTRALVHMASLPIAVFAGDLEVAG